MTPIQPRITLSTDEMAQALRMCENEPIHIPGAIQPHGVMLVLHPATLTILQASTNTDCILGVAAEALIGQPVESVVGKMQAEVLRSTASPHNSAGIRSSVMRIRDVIFDAVIHRNEGGVILELEPAALNDSPFSDDVAGSGAFFSMLRGASLSLQQALGVDSLSQIVVDQVRELTGFERVMLYQFDEHWNGKVVAESRLTGVASYLGLHFPDSDIPAQARRLYARNPLRLIADTRYAPAPLTPIRNPLSGGALDMSDAVLRSVSPVHIQYLENMHVRASMSISILQNRRLWGLIACHHRAPRHIPYRARVAAELIGNLFAAQMFSLTEAKRRERMRMRDDFLAQISRIILPGQRFEEACGSFLGLAARALDAHGIVLAVGGKFQKSGRTPSDVELQAIITYLSTHNPHSVHHTENLEAVIADLGYVGGMLATPFSSLRNDFILWFRNPVQRLVRWAGKPESNIASIGTVGKPHISPRESFEAWLEVVSGSSQTWDKEDIDTANRILQIILESAKLEAESANAAKSDFLARMSHELRTPMNAILGLVTILERTQKDPQQQKYLQTLRVSSNALLNVINDLLDISRIEAREFHLDVQPLSLAALAEEVANLMRVQADAKKLRLTVALPKDDPLWCRGDPHRLKQIMTNLLSNAIKFTATGEVTLRLRREQGQKTPNLFVIAVQDTGIGILADKFETIFDRFTQADSGITRRYGGTGLGLAICKHLVSLMEGAIHVESTPGQGSTFTVSLPLPEATPDHGMEPGIALVPAEFSGSAGHILLVEDYEANIIVAVTLLKGMGYTVDVARTGVEALELLQAHHYHAVLMDVQMPELDGYTATRRLRALEAAQQRPHLPVIGMTAHALAGDREKCLAAGMDDYLPKPFQASELQQKLLQQLKQTPDTSATVAVDSG